jgi:uncharacterized alpha-E superfamily protein
VLVDESNPRALAFQLASIAEHLDRLPEHLGRPFSLPEQKLAHAALSAVRLADVDVEQDGGLGGLPPVKIHCSVLAEEALKAALEDYLHKHPEAANREARAGKEEQVPA